LALPHPCFQHFCRFWTERRASVFSALSLAADMGTCSQNNVLASQAYQLGDPKASRHGKQPQGPVAAPYPSGKVGCPQKGIDLFAIQKLDRPTFVAFGRHREDSLAMQCMGLVPRKPHTERRNESPPGGYCGCERYSFGGSLDDRGNHQ